ncbi:acyloxyacyl hydrolase [Massilia atriviolacea]|uniref:acyloxyacyl hydrolase n=1 Tax=Massilia atriviolacea TaxID=2495579 RepID=UPI0018E0904F|nr:acyloxyacyl hydrolase [Massilia atriviolacea]
MSLLNMKLCASLATLAVMAAAPCAFASDKLIDHASLEVGGGAKVQMVRFGVQKDWSQRWFQSNGTHISGYWDASIAQWRGNAYQNVDGQHQNITNIGFTPVFRFQADDLTGWYGEAGIGLNLLSKRYDNDSNYLSTAFQFGDHIGTGYVFANGWDVGMKIQHFSNGGYKKPNSGVNFLVLKASRTF